ncbi:MAG: MFS transporter [Proteobacteria bacterium]|nr:MFS transporter [Pseudomonadota bacterium]
MSSAPTARACALDVLDTVLGDRRPLDDALADHAGLARLEARDRAFARLLVSTTLRRLGQIDALIAHCLDKPLSAKAARIRQILRLGTCQLAFLGTPPHAAVDGAVSLVGRNRAYKGLVNAVLRRLAREGAGLAAKHDAPRLDTPGWLWESWRRAYGEATARAIAEAHLAEPPLDITVKRDAEGWARRLDARVLPTGTLRRALGGAVADLDGYAEGGWWVQDAAASLPARLLGDVAGETVIELCAAPGGKTAQLAAAGAHVVAVDRSAGRLDRLRQNLARLGLAAETIAADATRWRPRAPARFVLLDAPCSATGAIRRRPDIPHLKTAADVARLAALQDRLLDAAYPMLAPGGTLVWSVCSLEPEEGPERIAALLERAPGLERVAITAGEIGGLSELVTAAGDLRTLPCHLADRGGLDGFFVARLRRTG